MTQTLELTASDRNDFATVPLSSLRLGARLRTPIYDSRDDNAVLLLAAGTTLSASLLQRIQARGISSVRLHRSELNRVVGEGSGGQQLGREARTALKNAANETQRTGNNRWGHSSDSFVNRVKQHGSENYSRQAAGAFARDYDRSVEQVESLFDRLSFGDVSEASELATVSSQSLVKIAEDLDLFVALGMTPATDKYPCKHSLQSGMLAMSIGTMLGLKPDELIELGVGCLIHDAGMLKIDPQAFHAPRGLSKSQFLEITKHPIITYDMLSHSPDVPIGARMVAYQMHERLNGTGYPRQRVASQIHHLAKIAMVADVFVALVSPRPHRPGLLPYCAMEQIIHEARQGLFDPNVVRALLHAVSLFPIGSCVELSDGRVGRVLRSNCEQYTRPVCEVWQPESGASSQAIVNLKDEPALKITRPLPELPKLEAAAIDEASAAAVEEFWE